MNAISIVYSRRFDRDLGAILRFLRSETSSQVAEKIRDKIFEAIEVLFENPERYPAEPRLAHLGNYRVIRLRTAPYKIFYRYAVQKSGLNEYFIQKETSSAFSGGSNFDFLPRFQSRIERLPFVFPNDFSGLVFKKKRRLRFTRRRRFLFSTG